MNNHLLLVRILAGKYGFPWGNQTDPTPNPCLWGVCNLLEGILGYLRWLACKIERGVPYSEIEFSWGFRGGKARMPMMWKRRMGNICEGRSIRGRIWILGGNWTDKSSEVRTVRGGEPPWRRRQAAYGQGKGPHLLSPEWSVLCTELLGDWSAKEDKSKWWRTVHFRSKSLGWTEELGVHCLFCAGDCQDQSCP